ncbi:MAG: hypothetical protein ABFS12_16540 [Bacteroidota bacterium]
MKNLFVLIFLVSTLNLFGQDVNPTQKGNLMLGGSGAISYFTQFEETSSGYFSLSLNPSIGWFLSDGFALGIGPTFYVTSNFSENGTTSLGIGTDVFLAKYFASGLFIKGSTGYSLMHFFESSENYDDHTIHVIGIIPEVGYAFFLGPNVALELSLANVFNIWLSDGSTSYHNTSSIKVGFQIFL